MKLQFRLLALCLLSVALLGTDASSGNAQAAANSRAVTPLAVTAGGDTCAAATVIATLPYDDTSDTTGKTDQGLFLNMTCAGAGAVSREGPDLVYTFTVGTGSSLTFTLMPSASYDATIYIVGNCTSGSSCVVESDTGIEGQTLNGFGV